MVVNIKLSVDTQRAIARLKRAENTLEKGSVRELNATANVGKRVAFDLAPKNTGKTAKAIKMAPVTGRKGSRKVATVIAKNGHPHKTWKGEKFNLTYWMHYSGKAVNHIKTGEPRFMFKAGEIVKKELGKNFRKLISGL